MNLNLTCNSKICEKRIKRTRKKCNYKKINNTTRQKLIELVNINKYLSEIKII